MKNIIHITDLSDSQIQIFSKLNETQLAHYYEPACGIFIAESPNVIERALNAGYEPIAALCEERYLDSKLLTGVKKYTAPIDVLEKLTGYAITKGMLCAMRRKEHPTVEMVCKNARRIAVLEDVVNPTNVGAIFRSAAALNMDGIILTSACSDPLYRRASRVSMGTVFQIPWTYLPKNENLVDKLHELDFKTVAMALTDKAIMIDDEELNAQDKLAVVLGTEGDGLAKETIVKCDYTVCIPMSHGVDSLNVAAASAVAFYELGKNNRRN